MDNFDYKKWLREQKDSLEPEDMPEKGDLDGDGEVSKEEIDIKKEFERELAKDLKKYNIEGDLGILEKNKILQSIKDVRNSDKYNYILNSGPIGAIFRTFWPKVLTNYFARFIVNQKNIEITDVIDGFSTYTGGSHIMDSMRDTLDNLAYKIEEEGKKWNIKNLKVER